MLRLTHLRCQARLLLLLLLLLRQLAQKLLATFARQLVQAVREVAHVAARTAVVLVGVRRNLESGERGSITITALVRLPPAHAHLLLLLLVEVLCARTLHALRPGCESYGTHSPFGDLAVPAVDACLRCFHGNIGPTNEAREKRQQRRIWIGRLQLLQLV